MEPLVRELRSVRCLDWKHCQVYTFLWTISIFNLNASDFGKNYRKLSSFQEVRASDSNKIINFFFFTTYTLVKNYNTFYKLEIFINYLFVLILMWEKTICVSSIFRKFKRLQRLFRIIYLKKWIINIFFFCNFSFIVFTPLLRRTRKIIKIKYRKLVYLI